MKTSTPQPVATAPARLTVPGRCRNAITRVKVEVVASAILLPLAAGNLQGCYAAGIESIDFNGPSLEIGKAAYEKNQEVLKQAEDSFQNSELLQKLKAQSEENKSKNKKALENKYCQRQAELGVGDCGGLRFIPGATKNGQQRTPDWLANLLGIEQGPEFDQSLLGK